MGAKQGGKEGDMVRMTRRLHGLGTVTMPTLRTPFALSRAGTYLPRGGGFNWRSLVRRGMGQDCTDDPASCIGDGSSIPIGQPDTGTPIDWNAIIQGIATGGVQIGKTFASYANPIYSLAPGTYYHTGPGGMTVSTAGLPGAAAAGQGSNMMPILLIGGGLLLVMMMARK